MVRQTRPVIMWQPTLLKNFATTVSSVFFTLFHVQLCLNFENYWHCIVVWNLQASGNAVLYCKDIGTCYHGRQVCLWSFLIKRA